MFLLRRTGSLRLLRVTLFQSLLPRRLPCIQLAVRLLDFPQLETQLFGRHLLAYLTNWIKVAYDWNGTDGIVA